MKRGCSPRRAWPTRAAMNASPNQQSTCTARFQDTAAAWEECKSSGIPLDRLILYLNETRNEQAARRSTSGPPEP
eukprot:951857-Pyramimonas_sp.AAC.1